MKTKSERFVESHRNQWVDLANILRFIEKNGIKKIPLEGVERFPRLYRQACQDLAEARMLELSPDVLEYLNNITGQAHHYLYFTQPLTKKDIKHYFTGPLPQCILRNSKVVLLAFLLFWGSAFGSFFAIRTNPELATKFIPQSSLDSIVEMYDTSPATGRSLGEKTYMSAFYIQHNTSIAFLCFATGIFLGLGSIYFLLFNGVYLGTIFAHLYNQGLGHNLIEFVTAHSLLELNGIVLSGAAGFVLGLSLLSSWRNFSLEHLKKKRDDILLLVGASALLLFCAALIEGSLSPSQLDYKIKVVTAMLSLVAMIYYFFIYPKRGRNKS